MFILNQYAVICCFIIKVVFIVLNFKGYLNKYKINYFFKNILTANKSFGIRLDLMCLTIALQYIIIKVIVLHC